MEVTNDFLSSFYSLNGTTIGERRKALNILLHKIQQDQYNELDLSLLQPRTPLEEKLKVEIFIYCKRIPELVGILKTENPILIERVLKVPWFVEKAFQDITGEELVATVFPYISFNTKVKLLNKLALNVKNPQKADDYFKSVERKYGFYLASKLLPACSADLIINCLKTYRIHILPRQLLIIIKRNIEITELILKELSYYINIETEYKIVFMYLAGEHISLFLKLHKEYNLSMNLGWRVTDKFIKLNKRQVIEDPEKFYKLLHNKQIAKSLNEEFKDMYLNLFPPSLKQLSPSSYASLIQILKQLPSKKQNCNLLLGSFEKVYGSHLWNYPEFINVDLLDMVPVQQRIYIVKPETRPRDILEEQWYCYMETEKAILYLKKAISLSSDIQTRVKFIKLLVETCKINKDAAALANICNYMISQHRNDHISVRLGFLNKILKSFKLEELEEQHWTPILELIKMFTLNNEQFYHLSDCLIGYIHYRLIKNLSIREEITQWIKVHYDNIEIIQEKPQFEKKCLLTLGEVIPETFKEKEFEMYTIRFLNALLNWNKRHPNDQIFLYNYLDMISSIKSLLSEETHMYHAGALIKYLLTETDSEHRLDLLTQYFFGKAEILSKDYEIIMSLLHREPLLVLANINSVAKHLFKLHYKNCLGPFWNYCKYYTHLEIPQKIIAICLSVLEKEMGDNYETEIKYSVAALSHLMTSEDFNQFSIPYYPENLNKITKSEKDQKQYVIQKSIRHNCRNVSPPSSAVECLLNFCIGNNFGLIKGSLYSLSGKITEDKLHILLNKLTGGTISMQKHVMHLTIRVLGKEHIYNLLNKVLQTTNNTSLNKKILNSVYNYFLTNPDDYNWQLVKRSINAISINDTEAYDILLESKKIPYCYFIQYFLFTWDLFNKLTHSDDNIENIKALLLSSIKITLVPMLPREFCDNIIKSYLFQCKGNSFTSFQSATHTFVCNYIIYSNSPSEQLELLELSFSLLKNCRNAVQHDSETILGVWSNVQNFVEIFCLNFLQDKCSDSRTLLKFADLWNSSFRPHDAFNEFLQLQFTLIYMENLTIPQTGDKIAKLCDSLTNIYGAFVLEVFCKKLNVFIEYFLRDMDVKSEENRYALIQSLMESSNSTSCLTLALSLVNKCEPSTSKSKEKYDGIIDILEKRSDSVLKLHLHSHYRDRSF